jgi:DNA-binding transcriptional MerR regulator
MLCFSEGELTMAHIAFDTLKFVEHLKEAGMPEKQAKALAEAQQKIFSDSLSDTVATKQDIADLRHELKEMEYRLIIKLGAIAAVVAGIAVSLVKLI